MTLMHHAPTDQTHLTTLPSAAPVRFTHGLVGHPLVSFDAMAAPVNYRRLLDEVVDDLAIDAHRAPATLTHRYGKLFHAATHTTSVARFAVDQTVIFQIEGVSTVHHGHAIDGSYHDQAERGYWETAGGELRVRPAQTGALELVPGEAVCLPAFTPYWTSVGASGSLTLAISFQTGDRSYATVARRAERPLGRLRAVAR